MQKPDKRKPNDKKKKQIARSERMVQRIRDELAKKKDKSYNPPKGD